MEFGIDCLGLLPGTLKEYSGGINQIDACYVAETAGSILLAFRGTDGLPMGGSAAQNLHGGLDWLNNPQAEPIKLRTAFPANPSRLSPVGDPLG